MSNCLLLLYKLTCNLCIYINTFKNILASSHALRACNEAFLLGNILVGVWSYFL